MYLYPRKDEDEDVSGEEYAPWDDLGKTPPRTFMARFVWVPLMLEIIILKKYNCIVNFDALEEEKYKSVKIIIFLASIFYAFWHFYQKIHLFSPI